MICRVVRAVRVRGRWAWIPGGGLRFSPFFTPNLQLEPISGTAGQRWHLDDTALPVACRHAEEEIGNRLTDNFLVFVLRI